MKTSPAKRADGGVWLFIVAVLLAATLVMPSQALSHALTTHHNTFARSDNIVHGITAASEAGTPRSLAVPDDDLTKEPTKETTETAGYTKGYAAKPTVTTKGVVINVNVDTAKGTSIPPATVCHERYRITWIHIWLATLGAVNVKEGPPTLAVVRRIMAQWATIVWTIVHRVVMAGLGIAGWTLEKKLCLTVIGRILTTGGLVMVVISLLTTLFTFRSEARLARREIENTNTDAEKENEYNDAVLEYNPASLKTAEPIFKQLGVQFRSIGDGEVNIEEPSGNHLTADGK
eukprot:GHVS01035611.1.p1 GENE.GHVS01035611.1~~GHVS01035611.1.p1  ORF type:complete len:289 (-),score=28.39 GHVS01035611.1:172-1038(-)